MKIAERRFTSDTRACDYEFRFFFDIHYGNRGCDVEQLLADIEYVRTRPNCYWFFGGDVIDAINLSDKRRDIQNMALNFRTTRYQKKTAQDTIDTRLDLDNLIMNEIADIETMFKPIADRCLGIFRGNHENTVRKQYHLDCTYEIARRMGPNCEVMEYSSLLRMTFARKAANSSPCQHIDWYIGHGDGSGGTIGAKINRIVKKGETLEANIYIMGHNHGLAAVNQVRLRLSHRGNLHLLADKKLYCLGGTYLKTYTQGESGYGEIAGYPAAPIGSLVIAVKPFNATGNSRSHNYSDCLPDYRVLNIGEAPYGSLNQR